MIISLHAEKVLCKRQHPFILKVSERLGIQAFYLKIRKVTYIKTIVSITLNGEELKAILLKDKDLLIQNSTQSST